MSSPSTAKAAAATGEKVEKWARPWAVAPSGKQTLPNGKTVDWQRGLVPQMEYIGEDYEEWLDHPKMGRCRLFDNDLMEALSFTEWWVVGAFYIPWGLLEVWASTKFLSLPEVGFSLACAVFMWTFFEYVAHRFLFHWMPNRVWQNRYHFMMHGLHHITPVDSLRLVFPPALSLPPAIAFRTLFYAYLPAGYCAAICGFFFMGYAWYETTHYLAHHNPCTSYLQDRFRFHNAHHFNPAKKERLYGVTQQWFDHVFGTA